MSQERTTRMHNSKQFSAKRHAVHKLQKQKYVAINTSVWKKITYYNNLRNSS